MADILIRGLDMPRDASLWLLIRPDGKVHKLKAGGKYGEPQQGVAVPLPEGHGRLIDADAIDRAFTDLRFNSDGTLNHWGDRPGWCMHGYEVEKLIADAPTIVPAEGGGEE